MMFDLYSWLKALHVAAALTFFAGVLGVGIFLRVIGPSASEPARALRRWDQMVTTPAMLLVWAFGLTLAIQGNWFTSGWLIAKLALVVGLSGLHGVQSGKLRRMAGGASVKVPSHLAAPLALLAVTGISILVILKPSGF